MRIEFDPAKDDALAKKEKQRHLVIPAKAGIQCFQEVAKGLDTVAKCEESSAFAVPIDAR